MHWWRRQVQTVIWGSNGEQSIRNQDIIRRKTRLSHGFNTVGWINMRNNGLFLTTWPGPLDRSAVRFNQMGTITEVCNVGKSSVHFKVYRPSDGFYITNTGMKSLTGYRFLRMVLTTLSLTILSLVYKYYIRTENWMRSCSEKCVDWRKMKARDYIYSYCNIKSVGFKKPTERRRTLSVLIREISIHILRKLQEF